MGYELSGAARAVLASAALALSFVGGAAASTLVVDRGLPTDNLNNAAGGDRSNVAWGFEGGNYQTGDTFSLGTPPAGRPSWRIDRLTGWFIAGSPDDEQFELADRFSDVSLFMGPAGSSGTIEKVATTSITGNAADAANVQISQVTYKDGSDYQGSDGGFIRLWQIDFLDLGIFSPGDYLFSIAGLAVPGLEDKQGVWFNHASNAGLGGEPADSADGLYAWLSGTATDNSLSFGGFLDSDGYGWDKSSDLNVQVYASAIPLPAAGWLLIGGLGALVAVRRRKPAA